MKKIWLLFLVIFLSSCKAKETQNETQNIVVGFSQVGIESAWRRENTSSILESANNRNIQIMYENGMLDQQKQISDIRKFISYQVDVIILSPVVETGWDKVLTEAKKAEIPVIISDREISTRDNNLFVTHVGSNFKSQGIRAGSFLREKYLNDDNSDVNIVEITGNSDSTPTIYRSLGFKERLQDNTKFKIIDQESGNFIRAEGREAMDLILSRNPIDTIDVIFSHNDEMTFGIIESLSKFDVNLITDLTIITVDGQRKTMDYLKGGEIKAVIECNPYTGPIIMNTIEKILNDEYVSREINLSETYFTEFSNMTLFPYFSY